MKANKKYIEFYTFPFHCLGEILICDQLLIQLSLLFKKFFSKLKSETYIYCCLQIFNKNIYIKINDASKNESEIVMTGMTVLN